MLALMNDGKRHGCDLVVFPERALATFFPRSHLPQQADVDAFFERQMPGAETPRLFDAARRLGVGREGILGMAICNDRRGPETYRILGLQAVEMILIGDNPPVH